jgi:hypothetical protein
MTQAQKTIAKPAAKPAAKATVKPAAKPAAKQAAKPAAKPAVANITGAIVEGIAKRIEAGSKFYARAMQYHKQAGTAFPRARNNERRAALKAEDVTEVFRQHDAHILAAGNANGQAMFDVYMMQAK